MRQIVFFDVDGTLVDDATQVIPESAVEAIRALRAAGHLAVVNTGRPPEHIDPRILAMGWDGVVAGCGMYVMAQGRVIHRAQPDPALCRRMRDLVRDCGLDVFFEAPHGLILDNPDCTHPEVLRECGNIRARGLKVTCDADREDFSFLKFITYDRPGCSLERFLAESSRWFSSIDRGHGMRENVLLGNTKSTGIRRILDHFGLTAEDACAFGDSTNDLPMFECVGRTVAMGGSDPRLTARAMYTTAPVLSDGIQKGLQLLGLIG